MEQLVRVERCNADGTAQVICLRQSACSGDCHKCAGCGAVQQSVRFTAANPVGAKPGDTVVIASASGPVLRGAAVLYMIPLILFFAGYLAGLYLWGRGTLAGVTAFALGVGLAVVYDRRAAKRKTVYTITGFGADRSGAPEKEDEDLG